MCKHGSDDEIKDSEMIKPKDAMFYFNNEKEDEDDSIGTCEDDELDEGMIWDGSCNLFIIFYIWNDLNSAETIFYAIIFSTFSDPFHRLREKLNIKYLSNSPLRSQKLRYHGKSIFFSRHGESEYNVENKVGGDSPLSERGAMYALALGRYFNSLGKFHGKESNLLIYH